MIPIAALTAIASTLGGGTAAAGAYNQSLEERKQIKAYNKRLEEAAASKRAEASTLEAKGNSTSEFARSAMLANRNKVEVLDKINIARNASINELAFKASDLRSAASEMLLNKMKVPSKSTAVTNALTAGVKAAIASGAAVYSLGKGTPDAGTPTPETSAPETTTTSIPLVNSVSPVTSVIKKMEPSTNNSSNGIQLLLNAFPLQKEHYKNTGYNDFLIFK